MATRKQLIAGVASVAVVGIVSFLGYKLAKELNKFDIDDSIWENLDDIYHPDWSKNRKGS
jgi:hypothetical protein